jgi:histidinol-phosphate aminotransferase
MDTVIPHDFGAQGGDLRAFGPGDYYDYSTCVNRYGPPSEVAEVLRRCDATKIRCHPYDSADRLTAQYANHLCVVKEELVAGRGTTEFIWSLSRCTPHTSVSVLMPAYTDFLRAFPGRGSLPDADETRIDALGRLLRGNSFVVISNPCNPTGECFTRDELEAVCCMNPKSTLVIDESYMDFVEDHAKFSMIGNPLSNVVVLRSPSKFFGIAGARCGVAWTRSAQVLSVFRSQQDTWPVSFLDVEITRAAMAADQWAASIRRQLIADGQWLESLLQASFSNVVCSVPVHFRFVYTRASGIIAERLRDFRVLVRCLGASHGVVHGGLRITAPLVQERQHFANALRAAISKDLKDIEL